MRHLFGAAMVLALLSACASSPTGRSQLMIVPESTAISASQQAYRNQLAPYARAGRLDNDPALKARVDRITSRLVAQAVRLRPDTEGWEWSINILDDPKTVNAWAMAGGKMALYTGLVLQIEPSDDELAQVLGHEIAHALAKHTAEKMSVALATQLGVAALALGTGSQTAGAAGALAASLAIELPYSRTAESEADRIGIELAAKAGYDPRAAVSLWRKMARVSEGKAPPQFLSTHPSPSTRIQELAAIAPKMMPYYEQARQSRPAEYRLENS